MNRKLIMNNSFSGYGYGSGYGFGSGYGSGYGYCYDGVMVRAK
jgi:hypothetical protein